MGPFDEVAGRRPRPWIRPGAVGGAAPWPGGALPSVFVRRSVGSGNSPVPAPEKYSSPLGPLGPVDRRETKVLAYMYFTLVTLVAFGVAPAVAVAAATSAGIAAARLLRLL